LRFEVHDLRDLPYPSTPYDVILSFEVLEHLAPGFDALGALADSVTPDGVVLVSTPNDLTWRHLGAAKYEYHVNMQTPKRFVDDARAVFGDVELLGMRANGAWWYSRARALDRRNLRLYIPEVVRDALRRAAGVRGRVMTPADVTIGHDQIEQSHTLLLICRRPLRRRAVLRTRPWPERAGR
jgi:SAM-dependent methyltransferase